MQVGFNESIRAQNFQAPAGCWSTEVEVQAGGASFCLDRQAEAFMELLAGQQLAAGQDVGLDGLGRSQQVLYLTDGVHSLLEDDVAFGPEHPVAVLLCVQLGDGHGQLRAYMQQASNFSRLDSLHQTTEGRVKHMIVVDRQGQALGLSLGAEIPGVPFRQGQGFFAKYMQPSIQSLLDQGRVQIGRRAEVNHPRSQAGQFLQIGHAFGHRMVRRQGPGPSQVRIADRHHADIGILAQGGQMKVGDVACAYKGNGGGFHGRRGGQQWERRCPQVGPLVIGFREGRGKTRSVSRIETAFPGLGPPSPNGVREALALGGSLSEDVRERVCKQIRSGGPLCRPSFPRFFACALCSRSRSRRGQSAKVHGSSPGRPGGSGFLPSVLAFSGPTERKQACAMERGCCFG